MRTPPPAPPPPDDTAPPAPDDSATDTDLPVPEDAADPATRPAPRLRDMFWVWFRIGTLSFGGGASTLFLMRREFVQTHRWMTGDEYNRAFALSKLVPGINIVAQSILMGKMVAGLRGGLLSVAALIFPSVVIKAVMAAFVTEVQRNTVVQAMMAGVVPAASGLTFAIVLQMIGRNEMTGPREIARGAVAMGACAAAFGLLSVPVPFVLLAAASLGALFPGLAGVPADAPPTAAEAVASAATPAPGGEEARR